MNYADPSGHDPEWWQWAISITEVVIGIGLCFIPFTQPLGGVLIGTGIGSMINGYLNEYNGGSFTAGWAGGQVSGVASLIPGVGTILGAFLGSVVTDWMDFGWNNIDWGKAIVSGVLAWALTLGPSLISEWVKLEKIYDPAIFLVNSINSVGASASISISNVFWRNRYERS